ncbi:fasciclin domain-containing protein [Roseateles amylovorans]|uniref:Fasciclin domain-containing protein n=1 Tax=Roseateles amylovorans TaxID=2978473 RepID=A0ABY6AT80_9BURK|nr:fasciclin domain-containing protein [Roseateles amylovorans]UXH76441.1 fasciclin domain-containing protein [Roseateles amylovorans]
MTASKLTVRTTLRAMGGLMSAAALVALTACATAPAPAPLADSLKREPELSTFNRLVDQAGLREQLRAAGPITVFAPSDEAFKAVPAKQMEALAADPALLKSVLTYHVVGSKVASADAKAGSLKSMQGASLAVARAGSFLTVEDAMVQKADLAATNGVAHVIDRVLMPPKK